MNDIFSAPVDENVVSPTPVEPLVEPVPDAPLEPSTKNDEGVPTPEEPVQPEAKPVPTEPTTDPAETAPVEPPPTPPAQGSGPLIHLTIQTGGETYECDTASIADAIASLGLKTTNTRTIVRAEYNGRVFEKTFFVAYARRLFFQDIARLALEKRIKLSLNV